MITMINEVFYVLYSCTCFVYLLWLGKITSCVAIRHEVILLTCRESSIVFVILIERLLYKIF